METEQTPSKALAYLESKAWSYQASGTDQAVVQLCPYCGNEHGKFYMNIGGGARDGLWDCKVCGEKGSLFQLMKKLGDRDEGLTSLRDIAGAGNVPSPMPNVAQAKWALHNDPKFADVLDYLVAERGYTLEVIEQMRLGAEQDFGCQWVIIPYFNKQDNLVFVKYRSVPPAEKKFRSVAGREASLYNENVIEKDMDELIFVEGEGDALSCLSSGVSSVVGVPGADVRKAPWITKVDNATPKKLYVLYDRDKAGQKGAREMAVRLGIEKANNIVLPEFTRRDGKPGKDINDWFRAGHTLEEFNVLKEQARPFDVTGVMNVASVVAEIQDDIENQGLKRYELDTPWPPLTEKLGGANYGEVIGVIAEGKVGKTTMVSNWLDHYAQNGIPSLLFCLEMTQKALVRKWICYKTQTNDGDLTKEIVAEALEMAKTMPADLLFGYTRVSDSKEVFELIRQSVRRYGVKVVAFDNLQFLVRSLDRATQETSNLSKQFKELAMELNILILLVIQPNRVREGEIVGARNAMNSSAVEKDVDAMLALHRNRVAKIKQDDFHGYLEADENFEPQLLCRVDLSRYAPGGVCTLWMDGAKSTVRVFTEDDKTSLPEVKSNLAMPTDNSSMV